MNAISLARVCGTMKPSDEKLAEFNGRMNTWIANQGLIFQLTHADTGLGGRSPILGNILRIFSSIAIIAAIGAISYIGFLSWKATGDRLPEELSLGIADALKVEKAEARGFKRTANTGSFKSIFAVGDEDSFFDTIEVFQPKFSMGITDGLFSTWKSDKLIIESLTADLKAGSTDDQLATQIWNNLFTEDSNFKFNILQIASTNISWGYASAPTWGQIKGSRLKGARTPEGWDLTFTEGYFSQGFFRDFQIKEMTIKLDREKGLKITDAQLECDEGSFTFSAEMSQGGASPKMICNGQLANVPVSIFLPRGLQSLVTGRVSGTVSGEGSINDVDGIAFQLDLSPSATEPLYLTNNIPLLRMLGQLDPGVSYRKLPLNKGSFQVKSDGQSIAFKNIALTSLETQTETVYAELNGDLIGRPSSPKDLADQSDIIKNLTELASQAANNESKEEIDLDEAQTLSGFNEEIHRQFSSLQFSNPHTHYELLTKDTKNEELKRYRIEEKLRRPYRSPFFLEGTLSLQVPKSAFVEQDKLSSVSLPSSSEDFATISIFTNNLAQQITQSLITRWENEMNQPQNFTP